MITDTFATRICARWVNWYTRSCPADAAAARREEIESDVWEHATDAAERGVSRSAFDVDVIRRVLSGVPADLSWRREVLRSHTRSDARGAPFMSRPRRIASYTTLVLAALAATPAIELIALLGSSDNGDLTTREQIQIVCITALGVVLLVGLVLRARGDRPVLGTALLAGASPAPAMALFWFPPVYVLSAALLVMALVTHPRSTEQALT